MDELERLGLLENTLIIYTTDHGGALGSNGGLVDKGWLMVDETVRIPMTVRWPDRVEAGITTDQFVSNMDLVPTVLEAAGAEMLAPMDGKSLLPLFQQSERVAWREEIMLEHHGHYGEEHFQRQLRYSQYKYVAHLEDCDELYDLRQDPYELDNLAESPQLQTILKEMRRRLRHQMKLHEDDSPQAQRLIKKISII